MNLDAWGAPRDLDVTVCPICNRHECAGHNDTAEESDTADGGPRTAYDLTDLGNAEYFAASYADVVRFDHMRKRWLVWDAPTWRPDADAAVQRLAQRAAKRRIKDVANMRGSAADQNAAAKHAIRSCSRDKLTATLALAQTLEPIADSGTGWDADPMLLACPNGVVDLRTGALRPGRPEDRLTMRAGADYEPTAAAPRFEQFVSEIFGGDADRVSWLHKAIGYSLCGATAEQIFFMLYGTGANGKGTLTRAIGRATGDYAYNLPFSSFEARPSGIPNDLAALTGRRFVTASETNDGTALNEARLKMLTGEDTITARFMHGEFFQFRPVGKLWLSVNHKPVVKDQSHGFWRRVRLIPFEQRFGIDQTLEPALEREAAGILAWMVTGCLRWQAEGLADVPEAVSAAVTEYQIDSDPLAGFLQDHTARIADGTVRAAALLGRYQAWADAEKIPKHRQLGSEKLSKALQERGFTKSRDRVGSLYHGLVLKGSAAVESVA